MSTSPSIPPTARRIVRSFIDFATVIGVYLLEAVDDDDPNILEEILIAPPSEDAP